MSTRICVSLAEETTSAVVDRMAELAPVADLFEVRADLMVEVDLLTILRARTRPIVFSCRPESAGGRYAGTEERRRLLLLEAVKRGFEYVDVELDSRMLDVMIEKSGSGLIVSHHDFEGTPDDLDGLYRTMADRGADVVKLAVTPRTFLDVVRLISFAGDVARAGTTPLVPIAMGPMGVITRLLAGRWSAPFTYAASAAGAETAPGQVAAGTMADLYRVKSIGPETRVYGVVGSEVATSFSPVLHNRAFEALGIDAVYVPIQTDALAPFMDALGLLRLSGFSVTRPYKNEMLAYLQEVEETAAVAGSVNTVVAEGGLLRGSSTDGTGVLVPLVQHVDPHGKTVVVLGGGGAARAAALALVRLGAHVKVLARDPAQAMAVAQAVDCGFGALHELPHLTWDVLVHATPVGSGATIGETLVPASLHRPGTVVFDMVYDPVETRLLQEAQAAGCTVIGGLEMLLAQAAGQFETWTGRPAPVDAMKTAALLLAQRDV